MAKTNKSKHTTLLASDSVRWIACPPSVKLCETYPDRVSPYAQEGTDAHELCAYKVKKALGRKVKDPTSHLESYNAEMEECARLYCNFVQRAMDKIREVSEDVRVLVEQRVGYSAYVDVPDGYGTADCLIIGEEQLHVIDFEYSLGVLVPADHNTQLFCYALGSLSEFKNPYSVEVTLSVFQPRIRKYSTFKTTGFDLMRWAESVLAPAAQQAIIGAGEFSPGEHCRFCKAKNDCRARAVENLKIRQHFGNYPPIITDKEMAYLLSHVDAWTSWCQEIKSYALDQALRGKRYPGYKLVECHSRRVFSNEEKVAAILQEYGLDPYETKLISVSTAEKKLGAERFKALLGNYIDRYAGKPLLVSEEDKRRELTFSIIDAGENYGGANTISKHEKLEKVVTG